MQFEAGNREKFMKYANLELEANKKMENIGDWVQIFAVDNLYRYMGIDEDDIVKIKISELSEYDGEYVVLPINYPFYGYYQLSPKIIPVYLGISVMSGSVADGLRMRNFQPIGCRDIHSMREIQKQGLEAYYGGCLTITFPKRQVENAEDIFIVDVSDKVLDKIPASIKSKAKYVNHVFYNEDCGGEKKAKEIYERYRKQAKLVITSRIHCAQPCIAAGIPVIFICEVKSFRYDVIRPFLPVYTYEEMDNIDWNPNVIEIEEYKKKLLELASCRVRDTFDKYNMICDVSEFYLADSSDDYEIDSVWAFQRYIKNNWNAEDRFSYAIWGITQSAEVIYEWIKKNYPNAILEKVIDNKAQKEFHGVLPQTEAALEGFQSVVFVTAGSANPVAEEVFKRYRVKKYVICYGNLYIVDGSRKNY